MTPGGAYRHPGRPHICIKEYAPHSTFRPYNRYSGHPFMAASEYLSARTEQESSRALKSSLYTGGAYVFTVACLVFPYLLFPTMC